ncbi:hypothetical protein TBCH5v1_2538 [Thermococcus barophilus]|uniref:Uncharacterized protein n=2 Tax=Thermococcus barophilus TaxID=55802 RepID=A0A0S1XF64_THEBA|nr:hypothetical protein TERMP_02152 [Thermococcus barophilus MP]ALM76428.1 hypothetical protein TBCH5v1_2538 [Thermococcus barophilus]
MGIAPFLWNFTYKFFGKLSVDPKTNLINLHAKIFLVGTVL